MFTNEKRRGSTDNFHSIVRKSLKLFECRLTHERMVDRAELEAAMSHVMREFNRDHGKELELWCEKTLGVIVDISSPKTYGGAKRLRRYKENDLGCVMMMCNFGNCAVASLRNCCIWWQERNPHKPRVLSGCD